MEEKINVLEEELHRLESSLKNAQPGSKEYYDLLEQIKILHETINDDKRTNSTVDSEEKKTQIAEGEAKHRIIAEGAKIVINVAVSAVSMAVLGNLLGQSFKFEETGTYSSRTGQEILKMVINKIPFGKSI